MGKTGSFVLTVVLLFSSFSICATDNKVSRYLSPDSLRPPLGAYSHGVETRNPTRWVHVAGQTGVHQDGSSPDDFETQARLAMNNVKTILAEADMGLNDIVSYRIYMTHREDLDVWKTLSKQLFADARPAGTLVFVAGLAHPKWRIEIEASAAR